jgi:hypothetical protein
MFLIRTGCSIETSFAFSRFEKRFSGDHEPSHVYLMADPVPGRAEIDAELGARRLQVSFYDFLRDVLSIRFLQ